MVNYLNVKKIISIFLTYFFLMLSTSSAMAMDKDPSILNKIKDKQLIDFFVDETRLGDDAMELAQLYLFNCCEDIDSILSILEKNGFKVSINSDSKKIAQIAKKYKNVELSKNGEPFTEIIFSERLPNWRRFWDIFAVYHVDVFIKDGIIEKINARVVRTMF